MPHPTIETEEHAGEIHGKSCFCNIPEIAGPSWWAMLHNWAKAINEHGCSSCGAFAVDFTSFFHDLVNRKLGKPMKDPANFVKMVRLIAEVAADARTERHQGERLLRHHQDEHPNHIALEHLNLSFHRPRFNLGRLVATPGALAALEATGEAPAAFISRHVNGDWGDLSDDDRKENELSVGRHLRVFSAYHLSDGTKVWVITEADRSATTILLPDEY